MKLVTTLSKTSPMSLSDRICWSVMVSRTSVSQYRIRKFTGLSREAIRQSVKVLNGFRLAKEEDGKWVAVEPDELSKAWFSWVKDSEGKPLGQRLRYTKVVPKETGEGIAADCLLGLLRTKAAADILREKFLWARVDTLCDEWECVRCDAQKIPYDNQRKVFLRLITDETWYDLATPEPAKMAPEAVGPVGRTGNSRI